MGALEFGSRIIDHLPYEPTPQQVQLVAALARFYAITEESADRVFMLCGYAGTGKTSLVGALVKAIRSIRRDVVLLAPTGRAAKVFASFASHAAYTIHRKIYRTTAQGLTVASNPHTHTLFIVDEASMIGEGDGLLTDLIHYIYSGTGCRLLLVGDTAQLPPVGMDRSPAMSLDMLHSFGLKVSRAMLTQTVRQASTSGILHNATWLRRAMGASTLPPPRLTVTPHPDLAIVQPDELEDSLGSAIREAGTRGVIVITRSNRRAVSFNIAIRREILGRTDELARDELLMVAKNNYHWSKDVASLPFIANGDIATVSHINHEEYRYGLRWADVTLNLTDRDTELDAKILLDTLTSDQAALPESRLYQLAEDILADPDSGATPSMSDTARRQLLRANPYFNALQVKYAYAVTCHKAQGGQWPHVYVDMGGIAPEAMNLEFYRWLYTAVTRATSRLYFVSPTVEIR